MPVLKLNPDKETLDRLLEVARCEKRPPDWQAEIMLRQALGLPFPYPVAEIRIKEKEGREAGND